MRAGVGSLVGVYAEGERIRPALVVGVEPRPERAMPRLNLIVVVEKSDHSEPMTCVNVPHIGDSDRAGAHPGLAYVIPDRSDAFVWTFMLEALPFRG